ncbi:MAG: outer membrane beta-barrel protein [Flaviramulus sp.]|nr:outer membrane beta-barrel protein [Flaviramulus sp.]NNC49617.1 outer membrane beta-barrel protein [Flaviramulus sp.]
MSDKKHIDRLFQEGLKDFEATPNKAVWNNIEAKLIQKKKKRRIVPIWWRYAGVAALLLLLLTIGGVYFNSPDDSQTIQVVDTKNDGTEKSNLEIIKPIEDVENSSEINTVIANDVSSEENNNKSKKDTNKAVLKILKLSNETSIAGSSTSKNKNESNVNLPLNKASNAKNKLINTNTYNAVAKLSEKEANTNVSFRNKTNNTNVIASSTDKTGDSSIKNDENLINKEDDESLFKNSSQENNTSIASTKKDEPKNNALTIEEAIDKTNNIIEEENQNRWSIAPNAAPVYFNSLGEGSSIDPQFNRNSKSGELNMSYGLSAKYTLNNKISIRSGINRVNLGYNTNDVIVFQSVGVSSSSLQNVNNSGDDDVSIISAESINSAKSLESFTTTNTTINQTLGYIEIPLEIQYILSDKKLGINVIGGFSSFFLSNNEIISEAENGNRSFLGEANNINKISYSANFGLGLNYQVSKKIDLNLEPMFKYQINTFKNTSGSFTPFFIGVYTGFAFKF